MVFGEVSGDAAIGYGAAVLAVIALIQRMYDKYTDRMTARDKLDFDVRLSKAEAENKLCHEQHQQSTQIHKQLLDQLLDSVEECAEDRDRIKAELQQVKGKVQESLDDRKQMKVELEQVRGKVEDIASSNGK